MTHYLQNDWSEKIILALDFDSKQETDFIIESLKDQLKFVKVGMELFYSEGPSIINHLKKKNLKIFLDLKLHDIPNTVFKSFKSLCKYQVDMLTVHLSGGPEMLKRCSDFINQSLHSPIILGVTCLTSLSENNLKNDLCINKSQKDYVFHMAQMAYKCGIKGVICSPLESSFLKNEFADNLLLVTPGIRLESTCDDQKRVTTPKQAFINGSDYIVMGREVTLSKNPLEKWTQILNSLNTNE